MKLGGILKYEQERQSMQQISPDQRVQKRHLCATLATYLNATECMLYHLAAGKHHCLIA